MFLQYYSSTDQTVKMRALKVLSKALEISEEEQLAYFNEVSDAKSPGWFSGRFFWLSIVLANKIIKLKIKST